MFESKCSKTNRLRPSRPGGCSQTNIVKGIGSICLLVVVGAVCYQLVVAFARKAVPLIIHVVWAGAHGGP